MLRKQTETPSTHPPSSHAPSLKQSVPSRQFLPDSGAGFPFPAAVEMRTTPRSSQHTSARSSVDFTRPGVAPLGSDGRVEEEEDAQNHEDVR